MAKPQPDEPISALWERLEKHFQIVLSRFDASYADVLELAFMIVWENFLEL